MATKTKDPKHKQIYLSMYKEIREKLRPTYKYMTYVNY